MKIIREDRNWISVVGDDNGKISTQSVEANLLFAIVEKLEEIRCNQTDIEEAINRK